MIIKKVINNMKLIDVYAKRNSTDPKIYVGAVVGKFFDGKFQSMGIRSSKTC